MTFERLMEMVLRGISWETCTVYLDDIIVIRKTFVEHLENLELLQANLKLIPQKCNLLRTEVKFLVHIVSRKGIYTTQNKLNAIKEWLNLKNKRDLRSFLNLSTDYRRFVPNYLNLTKSPSELIEQRWLFIWTTDLTIHSKMC